MTAGVGCWRRALSREEGQDLAEYGLLLLVVTVAAVGAVSLIGQDLSAYWSYLVSVWPF
ncbi:MAG: Flp family type IVb pilin [Anaerolineae bacterium]|nr:Flp family type IVb pilin [Anaerolineae bacterium]